MRRKFRDRGIVILKFGFFRRVENSCGGRDIAYAHLFRVCDALIRF